MVLDTRTQEVWESILKILDEKLQYGYLKQVESVVDVKLDSGELTLFVSNNEALEFFLAPVNRDRLIIMSRPIITLETVKVERVLADPLQD